MATTWFITGTDTGVGKTHIACALLQRARADGLTACGYKPVAAGCERTTSGLRNADALALQRAVGTHEPYALLNPVALESAIAPHLAATGPILTTPLNRAYAELAARYDVVVIEGAGGWQVPLSDELTMAGWVAQQNWPVILVVGMRLGCINHALLSAESILRRTRLAGWVANVLPPAMAALDENISTLRQRLRAPLLGIVPAGCSVKRAGGLLTLPRAMDET